MHIHNVEAERGKEGGMWRQKEREGERERGREKERE